MKPSPDARSLTQSQQALLREKAVAMSKKAVKQVEIASLLGIHKDTVNRWIRDYRQKGKSVFAVQKKGKPRETRLTVHQQRWIQRKIIDKHPEQLKLPFALWTREAVAALIKQKFGLVIPLRTLTDYFKRWGFTPQKPARQAIEQKPEALQAWLKEEYPAIEAKAKRENGLIYWGDEMGLRSDHQAGRSFSPKGQTPIIPVSGNRFGCNMISALTNRGQLAFSLFEGSFVVAVFQGFLERLVKHAKGQKVFLIVDGHPVHKAKAIKQWLEGRSTQIEIHYLPADSPDRNPDELLNQELKATVYQAGRPKNKADLKRKLKAKLYSIQKQPDKIEAYFKKPSVAYAAG
jgi:transposase